MSAPNLLPGARRIVLAFLLMLAWLVAPLTQAADGFLDPQDAFKVSAAMVDASTLEVRYVAAEGYYLYRERFGIRAEDASLGAPVIPPGQIKFDETFQKDEETYRNTVAIRIPVQATGPFTLKATYQGCADAGLCYPPMDYVVRLEPFADSSAERTAFAAGPARTVAGNIEATLNSGRLLAIAPLFLLVGLGLAFTPCMLPMVPILSAIIVGDKAAASRGRALALSLVYALGMAIVYTLFGVAAGLAGAGLAAALQNAWVLGAFALLMGVLSLSMFGVFPLQIPAAIQARLMHASDRQRAGRLAGVFIMGALSALIVGPCVAAPLAGVLLYISQTRDVLIGAGALFAMAVGMSMPLILMGASAGALLPRAGAWMESVKRFFGVLMLATALWMVSPVLPARWQMIGWAALAIGYAGWLLSQRGHWLAKAAGIGFAVVGLVQVVGAASGGRDVLAPLAHLSGIPESETAFKKIKSVSQLDALLASHPGRPVMLDFYADWCVSCKEMEKLTFSDARVKRRFDGMLLLQADVTANDADDKALLKRFSLFGPPGILFFDKSGKEQKSRRVIGYQDADRFLESLPPGSA
ncbi:protein-disulfide reductase DsbD [Noviherbaspirillum pedocola]|uniref:Thiol:disulfide interchange protein DsbD n=1 Tax=Noviherbaspirillum pedocola TaxID=2801341 RepID=A0A934W6C8_9BURK|nr:protein-disulfide reductase DsbD [Noviherbaspirillum pedocola]MBK4734965.1 protein-disulfide reductase DsbD [Noviherbaspirillum pedocola]